MIKNKDKNFADTHVLQYMSACEILCDCGKVHIGKTVQMVDMIVQLHKSYIRFM